MKACDQGASGQVAISREGQGSGAGVQGCAQHGGGAAPLVSWESSLGEADKLGEDDGNIFHFPFNHPILNYK